MPSLNISTNVPLDGVNTSGILSQASKSVAQIIGKPEAYVMVQLKGSVAISFEGIGGRGFVASFVQAHRVIASIGFSGFA